MPAGSSATITVTVAPNSGLTDDSIFGGYIVVTPQADEAGEVHVPYSGLKADYQSVAVLTPTTNGFPWLAKLSGSLYVNQPSGATYTMAGTDIPFFLVHLDQQARWMRMEVFDAKTGRSWHRAFQDNYLPRNSSANSFSPCPGMA